MSEVLISSLNSRVAELTQQLSAANAEAAKYRKSKRAVQEKLDAEIKARAEIEADREAIKGKLTAAPGELQAEIQRLNGELRTRDHRDAWKAATGDLLHEKASVEKVWSELDYKPDGDAPTPEQISELVGKAKEAAPYLFKQPPVDPASTAAQAAKARAALNAAPGSGRGPLDNGVGKVLFSRSDLSNPRISLDPAFVARQKAAVKAGTFEIVD